MRPHIVFLHTSPVHVETFDRLVGAMSPALQVEHVVDEALLAEAQRVGAHDPALVQRVHATMIDASARGAPLVVCTCSTLGGAAEKTPTGGRFKAARIDRAMADQAVQTGPKILVVAALRSTLGPTTNLIDESATALRLPAQIESLVVEGAWAHFQRGDGPAYLDTVAAAVSAACEGYDVVVLAQASMAPAAAALADLGVPVLASPMLGVQAAIAHLQETSTLSP